MHCRDDVSDLEPQRGSEGLLARVIGVDLSKRVDKPRCCVVGEGDYGALPSVRLTLASNTGCFAMERF